MKSIKPADGSICTSPPQNEFEWEDHRQLKTQEQVIRFFHGERLSALKARVCAMGRRLWSREYVDGNGGNISVRVARDLVVCTPTLISKGFMAPEDLCLVDMEGRQKAGGRPPSSEIRTHLAIMREVPEASACVHAHPPHANAFLICAQVPPTGVMPEPDIFLGEVGMAPYATPGTEQNARNVGRMAKDRQCIFMQNHGVITWGNHVEDAYWKIENIDAYCRILLLSTALTAPVTRVDVEAMRDFVNARLRLGMPDKRAFRQDDALFNAEEFAGRRFSSL